MVPEGDAARLVREQNAGEVLCGGAADVAHQLEAFVERARAQPAAPRSGDASARYAMDAIVDELERVLREVSDGSPA
jgi:hypothetical protein